MIKSTPHSEPAPPAELLENLRQEVESSRIVLGRPDCTAADPSLAERMLGRLVSRAESLLTWRTRVAAPPAEGQTE